eukprot:898683-Pyramimonas_sp.AAC.1
MSLLGRVAWMVLTRADIVVYVGKLQRNMKDVKISDSKDLNKVLKWIKRAPSTIIFSRPTSPLCMTVIADSAYPADDVDCLALRAASIGLCEVPGSAPSGCFHVWEYFSRKQAKVIRGTFSAELNNAIEATEYGMLLNGFLEEWLKRFSDGSATTFCCVCTLWSGSTSGVGSPL